MLVRDVRSERASVTPSLVRDIRLDRASVSPSLVGDIRLYRTSVSLSLVRDTRSDRASVSPSFVMYIRSDRSANNFNNLGEVSEKQCMEREIRDDQLSFKMPQVAHANCLDQLS